jgi:hypothetical protein
VVIQAAWPVTKGTYSRRAFAYYPTAELMLRR